jgi:ATP-dependent helicase HrpB
LLRSLDRQTTRVPLELLLADPPWLAGRTVVVLEPRRLAARAAAQRMASALGEPVGLRVGYRVRFDAKVSKLTRVECVTEGVLLQRLRRGGQQRGLAGVGCVVLDEFHERSLDADLCLALLLDLQRRGTMCTAPHYQLLH